MSIFKLTTINEGKSEILIGNEATARDMFDTQLNTLSSTKNISIKLERLDTTNGVFEPVCIIAYFDNY